MLKVGLTVSASIPVAVISLTLFRVLGRFGLRSTTILEHNIVQTAGSAGESIAFGIGVTMPAIMILGFDLEIGRVMLVAALGGLLGILMMIPLRRALIVQQHGILKYPEGTACAEVLKAGATPEERAMGRDDLPGTALLETTGSGAAAIFGGFGAGVIYKLAMEAFKLWKDTPQKVFGAPFAAGSVSAEISPELLGVGYIIGPRIAATMAAGGVLAYMVLIPMISFFGSAAPGVLAPGTAPIAGMSPDDIRGAYVLYIGAGAVATGGIVSLFRSLPMIVGSLRSGVADWRAGRAAVTTREAVARTDLDLSPRFVAIGLLILVAGILFARTLHMNILGAVLIVVFGFLFVTVSSRLTGEIGSSSNPISGMTVATLLLTCLIFLALGWTAPSPYFVMALSVGGIVCVAASNGGTTSQDLKTGFLIGATPRSQQIAILAGALASALVLGTHPAVAQRRRHGLCAAAGRDLGRARRQGGRSADRSPEGPAGEVGRRDLPRLPQAGRRGGTGRPVPRRRLGEARLSRRSRHQRHAQDPPGRDHGEQVRRAQGHPDELHHQGHPQPETALEPGDPGGSDRGRAGDVRHTFPRLRGRGLSAAVVVLADLHRGARCAGWWIGTCAIATAPPPSPRRR